MKEKKTSVIVFCLRSYFINKFFDDLQEYFTELWTTMHALV